MNSLEETPSSPALCPCPACGCGLRERSAIYSDFAHSARITELLKSNLPPLDTDLPEIDAASAEHSVRLDELDAHIASLEENVEELKQLREKRKATLDIIRAITSSFRRTPAEIWREIFASCIDRDAFDNYCLPSTRRSYKPTMNINTAPMSLTHITSLWREVALSDSNLWTEVIVSNGVGVKKNLYNLYIERSKDRMISLCAKITWRPKRSYIKDLCASASRWRRVYLDADERTLRLISDELGDVNLSGLEQMCVFRPTTHTSTLVVDGSLTMLRTATSLRELIMSLALVPKFVLPPSQSIVSFDSGPESAKQVRSIDVRFVWERLPQLEECALSVHDHMDWDYGHLTHTTLGALFIIESNCIDSADGDGSDYDNGSDYANSADDDDGNNSSDRCSGGITEWLGAMTLPMLTTLRISCDHLPINQIANFISRSSCSLSTLVLDFNKWKDRDAWPQPKWQELLEDTPMLLELSITSNRMKVDWKLAQDLCQRSGEDGPLRLVPVLETLQLYLKDDMDEEMKDLLLQARPSLDLTCEGTEREKDTTTTCNTQ